MSKPETFEALSEEFKAYNPEKLNANRSSPYSGKYTVGTHIPFGYSLSKECDVSLVDYEGFRREHNLPQEDIVCPLCFHENNKKVPLSRPNYHGSKKDHFRHFPRSEEDKSIVHSPESIWHLWAKKYLENKIQFSSMYGTEVFREHWTAEISQRADVFVAFNDISKVAYEAQFSSLSHADFESRHSGYQSIRIHDQWLYHPQQGSYFPPDDARHALILDRVENSAYPFDDARIGFIVEPVKDPLGSSHIVYRFPEKRESHAMHYRGRTDYHVIYTPAHEWKHSNQGLVPNAKTRASWLSALLRHAPGKIEARKSSLTAIRAEREASLAVIKNEISVKHQEHITIINTKPDAIEKTRSQEYDIDRAYQATKRSEFLANQRQNLDGTNKGTNVGVTSQADCLTTERMEWFLKHMFVYSSEGSKNLSVELAKNFLFANSCSSVSIENLLSQGFAKAAIHEDFRAISDKGFWETTGDIRNDFSELTVQLNWVWHEAILNFCRAYGVGEDGNGGESFKRDKLLPFNMTTGCTITSNEALELSRKAVYRNNANARGIRVEYLDSHGWAGGKEWYR